MPEVVQLAEVHLAPQPEVVNVLEDMLHRARRGEIRGFALAAVCDRGCEATTFVVGDAAIRDLLVPMERLKLRLLLGDDIP